ncbi:hypothetical protein ACH4PU_25515 [Streptomyces sp. NPDC021100]
MTLTTRRDGGSSGGLADPTGPIPGRRADLLRRVREANRWSAERRP